MLFFRGAPCLSVYSAVSLPARRLLAWVPHSSRALFAREGWGAYTAVVRSRYFAIAAAISALDLASKFAIRRTISADSPGIVIIPRIFNLVFTENRGIVFGIL